VEYAFTYGVELIVRDLGRTPPESTRYLMGNFWQWTIDYLRTMAVQGFSYFLLVTVILLIWPFVVRHWERFFTRGRASLALNAANASASSEAALLHTTDQESSYFKYYALAAAFTGTLLLISSLL
jgi:hypothetical protein